jgi:hypothetical protein
LTTSAGDLPADARTGKNGRHALVGLFRQSVFGRLAGYEDVNDALPLRHDPAMLGKVNVPAIVCVGQRRESGALMCVPPVCLAGGAQKAGALRAEAIKTAAKVPKTAGILRRRLEQDCHMENPGLEEISHGQHC